MQTDLHLQGWENPAIRLAAAARLDELGRDKEAALLRRMGVSVEYVEGQVIPAPVFHDVPDYFSACCWAASQHESRSYQNAAYELIRHLAGHVPFGVAQVEWREHLGRLARLLLPTNPNGQVAGELREDIVVLGWFNRSFPQCMKHVPAQAREQFLAGVYVAVQDGLADEWIPYSRLTILVAFRPVT
jgi:hypothetical protein